MELIIGIIGFVVFFYFYFYSLRKKIGKKRLLIVIMFANSYLIVILLFELFTLPVGLGSLLGVAVKLICPIVVTIWLGLEVLPNMIETYEKRWQQYPSDLKDFVQSIFDSKNFLTVINNSLPKGKDDEKFGLDYIPFMLHNIDKRRKRFEKSSNYFLIISAFSGILFGTVIAYFGYILVNEASAGAPKLLSEIKSETNLISAELNTILPNYYHNKRFQAICGASLKEIEEFSIELPYSNVHNQVIGAIGIAKFTGEFKSLFDTFAAAKKQTENLPGEYPKAIDNAYNDLTRFLSTNEGALPKLSTNLENLNNLIEKADEEFEKTENRIPEILKRIAIGLLVVTFFLAILRYITGLYRSHYQEMLKAEYDDLEIRRFYIAFKGSENIDKQREAILSAFISKTNLHDAFKDDNRSENRTKEQLDIIRDIIDKLSKKL